MQCATIKCTTHWWKATTTWSDGLQMIRTSWYNPWRWNGSWSSTFRYLISLKISLCGWDDDSWRGTFVSAWSIYFQVSEMQCRYLQQNGLHKDDQMLTGKERSNQHSDTDSHVVDSGDERWSHDPHMTISSFTFAKSELGLQTIWNQVVELQLEFGTSVEFKVAVQKTWRPWYVGLGNFLP